LLLDAGNTLVFLDHDAIAELLSSHGEPVSSEALRLTQREANRAYAELLQKGGGHEDGWRVFMLSWLVLAGVPPGAAEEAATALRRAHDTFNLWRRVPDDLVEALQRVRDAGITLAVVSNSEGKLDGLFDRLGLSRLFDLVVDSAHEGVRKPDPEIFLRTCRRIEVAPAACLYAGDIPDVDVVGARAAGLDAALIDPFDMYADYQAAPRFPSVAALVEAFLAS
jgi:putative hydrolase of the HAD superfamily